MPLYRPTYLVEYDPDQTPLEVKVSSGDMLRAELEMSRLKLPEDAKFHLTALWLWSALVRLGVEERRAGEFIGSPPEFEPVKREDGSGEAAVDTVDPIGPGPGEPGSALPASTVTPDSGSTQI